jgi:acyl-coenzyme A thioesterase PaaI-like protein
VPTTDPAEPRAARSRPVTAFQDQMHDNFCWGCGADNHAGLRLRSWWDDDTTALARWTPAAEHAAGPRHVVNGGIIATVLDCHGVCTAVADAHRRQGRAIGTSPEIWYATTSITVDYLRPTPLGPELTLRATVASVDGQRTVVDCVLEAAGKPRATARVATVQVPEEWRRPPPG